MPAFLHKEWARPVRWRHNDESVIEEREKVSPGGRDLLRPSPT